MATNNTEKTTATAEATTSENNDKSLFSKAKDAIVNIKDQVKDLISENGNNDDEVKGMPKQKFEKTKAELESSLHFKQEEQHDNANVNIDASANNNDDEVKGMPREKFEETKAELESSLHFDQSKNLASDTAQFQNQNGLEFQSQNGANINMNYQEVNPQEFVKTPDVLLQQTEVVDDKKDEIKYSKLDKDEVHVLPTIHVQERPIIVEKEIEFEKPVEVKQTIIHKEKPVIIEKPTIIEKNEHYRDTTEYQRNDQKIVNESISEQDVGNQDKEALLNIRKEHIENYSNTTPIIKHEKQNVKLDTDIREQPVQINEKEVVYEQPIEIERTRIENIKPKVHEDITLKKEHVYEKTAPEFYQENPRVVEKEKYFSQDTTATSANIAADATVATNTNAAAATGVDTAALTANNNNDVSSLNAAGIAREENRQKKEIM